MSRPDSILAEFEQVKERWLTPVLALIETVIAETSPAGSSLVPMAHYHMETGGKRLRALIPIMVAKTLDVDPTRVLGFGAACEILHNATLVHDDLQDGDTTRRGQATVWAKWGAPRAINLGDAMLYWTLAAVAHVQFDEAAKQRLTQRIVRDTLQVIDGQEREFLLQEGQPNLNAYFRMVEGKTSGLFALPMAGTAELCGAGPDVVEALREAAGHLGVIFQIQDDVLDLYGDKGRDQRGSDLGEGKISALVAHFLTHAPAGEASWLTGVLNAPRDALDSEQVERAAQLFRERGSLEWVLQEIERRRDRAVRDSRLAGHPALVALLDGLVEIFVAPISAVQ